MNREAIYLISLAFIGGWCFRYETASEPTPKPALGLIVCNHDEFRYEGIQLDAPSPDLIPRITCGDKVLARVNNIAVPAFPVEPDK